MAHVSNGSTLEPARGPSRMVPLYRPAARPSWAQGVCMAVGRLIQTSGAGSRAPNAAPHLPLRDPMRVDGGFRFVSEASAPAQTGVRLSDKAQRAVMTTIREMTPPNWGRSITFCMAGLSRYLNSWMAKVLAPPATT